MGRLRGGAVTIIPAVIAWAFTLTFLIALVLVLLDVAGVRRIRDVSQRKWLFRSLFASVILAVVGFGTWQFNAFKQTPEPGPAEAKADVPARRPPPPPRVVEQPEAVPDEAEAQPQPSAPSVAPEVAAWALESLGERPGVPAAFDRSYPPCVAQLRGREYDDIDPADAADCRRLLSEHHVRYILNFYRLKEVYDRALRHQEIALRRGGVQPDETARYNFVVAENEDFNDPGGPTLQRLEEADARIRADMTACRTRRCRAET